MTIKTLPTTYRTSDGGEFTDRKQAERHEKMMAAKRTYEQARHEYAQALAESQRTADGVMFELTIMHTYYHITPGYFTMPELKGLDFYFWNCDINENDETVIVADNGGRRIEYKISSLYWDKAKAADALLLAWEERLVEIQAEFEKLKAKSDF